MPSIYVIGDSHTEGFKYLENNNLDKRITIVGSCVAAGRTAQGLNKTRNRKIFIDRTISDFDGNADYIALQFGEIDCAYTLWSRMKIHNTTKAEEIEYAIAGIKSLANDLQEYTVNNIILLGPIIPLVSKYQDDVPAYISKRRTINESYRERTELVLSFCNKLREEANTLGYLYTDINDNIIDRTTKLAKLKYRDKKTLHHLGVRTSAKLWTNSMLKLLKG
jgi:hypothetical protein